MLNELIDIWERAYWSEHVPDDSLSELLSCILESSKIYRDLVFYILDKEILEMIDDLTHYAVVKIYQYHTTVHLIPLETIHDCNVIAPTRAM